MNTLTIRSAKEMAARAISEKAFLQQVRDMARALGWRVYHTHDSRRSEPGFPDLVLVHPAKGSVVFAELKRVGGRLSPAQKQWQEDLARAGATSYVWTPENWEEIETVLQCR